MQGKTRQLLRIWCVLVLACALATLIGCSTITAPYLPTTQVTALPGEDLSGPCLYSLRLMTGPPPSKGAPPAFVAQAGVLVIFERGDSEQVFVDPKVIAMAAQLHLAMIFAYECDAVSFPDLQVNAAQGPSRALLTALSQFAVSTSHPELASSNLILFGFSAGGYLSTTMTNDIPSRILGAIPFAPASPYFDLDDVAVTPAAAGVPMLILANGDDSDAGTQRPINLYFRGWNMGAPWGFAVQKDTGHCCTDSAESLLVPWVTGLMTQQTTTSATGAAVLRRQANPAVPNVRFYCAPDGQVDVFFNNDCAFPTASVLPSMDGGAYAGWLPDAASAIAWQDWVLNPGTN